MRMLLTSTALALSLIAAAPAMAQNQDSPGPGTGNEAGGTTGIMTTTPRDASDDAVGTRGGDMVTAPAGDASGVGTTTGRMTSDNPLYGMRGEEIVGKTLYGANGEEIGEISNVVMAQGGSPEAVVGVGGFLGIGERDVTIPLSQITVQGDRLTTSLTKEGISARQPYDQSGYQEWERSRTFGSTAQ